VTETILNYLAPEKTMSITSQTDKSRNLTIFTASGKITLADGIGVMESFYKNPTQNVLLDFSHQTDTPVVLTSEDLVTFFSYLTIKKERRPEGKTAIVASDDLRYGMSRMAEALAEMENLPWKMKAFRSMDEANNWLSSDEWVDC
jgi:hypothetical protein